MSSFLDNRLNFVTISNFPGRLFACGFGFEGEPRKCFHATHKNKHTQNTNQTVPIKNQLSIKDSWQR